MILKKKKKCEEDGVWGVCRYLSREVRGKLAGAASLLSPCGLQELNMGFLRLGDTLLNLQSHLTDCNFLVLLNIKTYFKNSLPILYPPVKKIK